MHQLLSLRFAPTIGIEYLDAVIVGVGNDDITLRIDSNARWFRELPFEYTEFTEFLMIDHFMAFQCRTIGTRRQWKMMRHGRVTVHRGDAIDQIDRRIHSVQMATSVARGQ